jgi:uncharacterized protein
MPLMEFTWDENKRLSNLAKHGLDFEDARWVFTDEALAVADMRRERGATLYAVRVSLQAYRGGRFTMCDDVIRILSMRKANQREQRSYNQKRSKADRRHGG